MNRRPAVLPPSFMVFGTTEFMDRSAIRACVKKNRPVQAGRDFSNFRTDAFGTTRVRKIGPQTSRLATFRAFSWMNSRRGSTTSPIRVEKISSASSAGHSVFAAYFADGTNIGYGRQQIDRRGGRFVLPVQAKARIAPPYRAAFDYHCRLNMPADPILPAARADCVF